MTNRAHAVVRYDGPALSDHEMDVRDLAPALLALGELCEIANKTLNGDSASVRVLIRVDLEQRCFQFQLELVQTLYEQLTTFLDGEGVKDAKNLLEWLGLICGGGGGVFAVYKFLFGRQIPIPGDITQQATETQRVEARAENGGIVYQIVGDHNKIVVPREVHRLVQDPRSFSAIKKVLAPLQRDGYEKLEFEVDGRVTQYFTSDEAKAVIQAPEDAIVVKGDSEQISKIDTAVRVRKPVFEGNSKWNIVYKKSVEAKMVDLEWLAQYQAGRILLAPGWRLVVELEERVPVDSDGVAIGEPSYAILKVYGVERPPEQISMKHI